MNDILGCNTEKLLSLLLMFSQLMFYVIMHTVYLVYIEIYDYMYMHD